MTREEAKEILTHNWTRVDNPNYSESELDEAFFMAIEALSADSVQEWIPCSERLPNKSGDYLCTIPLDEVDTYTEVLTFHKGRFYEDDDEWGATYHDDVLAWMPLPKPYECGARMYKGGDDE